MGRSWKIAIASFFVVAVVVWLLLLRHFASLRPVVLSGVVIRRDKEPSKQAPVANVQVTASVGLAVTSASSDESGLFRLTLPQGVRRGQQVTLRFEHPGYQPLLLHATVTRQLYIARLTQIASPVPALSGPAVSIANVTIRYTLRTTTTLNVGSLVKTFEVFNTANVPCKDQPPCSPDGEWKAAVATVSLDAGDGNEFRRPRVSCIAGPCPFTRLDSSNLSNDGRIFHVSARDWSDPATFLVQAEVARKMSDNVVRNLYPVRFGDALDFTLPAEAEGPSIEAELGGAAILFPLGPELCLTWATCGVRVEPDRTKTYHCEVKAGYRLP